MSLPRTTLEYRGTLSATPLGLFGTSLPSASELHLFDFTQATQPARGKYEVDLRALQAGSA